MIAADSGGYRPIAADSDVSRIEREIETETKYDGSLREPTRAARPKKPQYREERRALMAEVAATVSRHHLPAIPEVTKQVFLSAALSLLQGGYSLDLIRRVAIATALEYSDIRGYSKLMQLRLRVRAEQAKIDDAEHQRIKAEEANTPIDPQVRDAIKAALRARRRPTDTSGIECDCRQLFKPDDRRDACSKCGRHLHPVCSRKHECGRAA